MGPSIFEARVDRVVAEVVGGIEHSADLIGGDVGLDDVDLVEDEASARSKDPNAVPDVLSNLLRRLEAEDVLRVAASAPKDDAAAVLVLQFGRIHAVGRSLDGVENIDAAVNEVFDEWFHGPATVQVEFPVRLAVEPLGEPSVVRRDGFREHIRAEHGRVLGSHVVGEHYAEGDVAQSLMEVGVLLHQCVALPTETVLDHLRFQKRNWGWCDEKPPPNRAQRARSVSS